jgi:ADP-ribosylglycohydrolase
VLKAVNLGSDTDTTAAVVGALAGAVYGFEGIPAEWVEKLRGKELVERILAG